MQTFSNTHTLPLVVETEAEGDASGRHTIQEIVVEVHHPARSLKDAGSSGRGLVGGTGKAAGIAMGTPLDLCRRCYLGGRVDCWKEHIEDARGQRLLHV